MSRGHGAAQRFLLELASQPLGTDLVVVARAWAQRKGWDDPCTPLSAIFSPGCHHAPPRAAYEAIRRAMYSLLDEGLIEGYRRMDRRGRANTELKLSDEGRKYIEQTSPEGVWWGSEEARAAYVARHDG